MIARSMAAPRVNLRPRLTATLPRMATSSTYTIFDWPFRHLYLDGLKNKVAYAQLLNDASEVRFSQPHLAMSDEEEALVLELPVHKPDVVVPMVELFLT